MTAKVTSKGRVTLPKAVRDLLGIKPGDVIGFERAPDGRIVLVQVDPTPSRIASRNCAVTPARVPAPTRSWL